MADTWWYGNTGRFGRSQFEELARLRARQGFDAVQIVVGIPPEVGPRHPEAASEAGPAWSLSGEPNERYLSLARDRISLLLDVGLKPIVYGGWGQQIDWIGAEGMKRWWTHVAATLSGLDVIYCLCGEADLHSELPRVLLPNRSTDDLGSPGVVQRTARRLRRRLRPRWHREAASRRVERWRAVLRHARKSVGEPLLVHTRGNTTAFGLFGEDRDLLANSTQTGHKRDAQPLLYERPLRHLRRYPGWSFINLEPWYEGINDSFGPEDQLFAFWASRLAGAAGHVYGAQGIWNAGDGQFLGHWGAQTLRQAIELETPVSLGRLHRWFREQAIGELPVYSRAGPDGRVVGVGRGDSERFIELLLNQDADYNGSHVVLDLSGKTVSQGPPPLLLLRGLSAP